MPDPSQDQQKIDIRMYIGMLVFRWHLIALCFLYAMLVGVLYIQFAPREYLTNCKLLVYRDPALNLGGSRSRGDSLSSHIYLLRSERLRERAVDRLMDEWGPDFARRKDMILPVSARRTRSLGPTIDISIRHHKQLYSEDFLRALLSEHEAEWESLKNASVDSATHMLEEELSRLEVKIAKAEDDLIEYQRLNDIARVEARGSMESAWLNTLMQRRNQLTTEMMILEAAHPFLKEEGVGVISTVGRLTRETGTLPLTETDEGREGEERAARPSMSPEMLPEVLRDQEPNEEDLEEMRGWQDLRVRLARLQQRERALLADLKPEHPQVEAVRKEIRQIRGELEVAAQVQIRKLDDRYRALKIQLEALEEAEYKWQAKNLLASKRQAELKRVAAVVARFENNYAVLYSRLHDMRVSEELKSEHLRLIEPVETEEKPVWPDPFKILLMALALGMGSGLGLVVLAQALDNKIQTVGDVERDLGVPFLGGIPFWIRSGLEKAIRPIVTEEHSSGAVEAYRALRTTVLAELDKRGEKTVLVTSADSREGKTLTVLNLAIMVAHMGKRVLLADMDLRRGRLHRSLGADKEPGLTDVLKDGLPIKSVIQKTRFEHLDFAPAGSSTSNTAELAHSADFQSLFGQIENDYDYIFMDSSPVLRVTDTVIMATKGFCTVLYVARVNRTAKPLIRYSLDVLGDAKVLGLVMNSIEMHKISSLYYSYQYPNYAYYSNAYYYGYDQYSYYTRPVMSAGSGPEPPKKEEPPGKWHSFKRWVTRTFLPME